MQAAELLEFIEALENDVSTTFGMAMLLNLSWDITYTRLSPSKVRKFINPAVKHWAALAEEEKQRLSAGSILKDILSHGGKELLAGPRELVNRGVAIVMSWTEFVEEYVGVFSGTPAIDIAPSDTMTHILRTCGAADLIREDAVLGGTESKYVFGFF